MVNSFIKTLQCLLLIFPAVCWAYTIRGSIDTSVFPLSSADFAGTTIKLTSKNLGPSHETYLQKSGSFVFTNVTSLGTYLLTLDSITLSTTDYSAFRIVIEANQVTANKVYSGHDWETDVGPLVEYPVAFEPLYRPQYVVEREKFSAIAMLKSPMVLLTLGSLVMVFLLPKMMENLDPEALQAIQGQNGQMKSPEQAWQDLKNSVADAQNQNKPPPPPVPQNIKKGIKK